MSTSAPDFNAFASWSKPKSLLDFDANRPPQNPNVTPERLTSLREARNVPYTGSPTGVTNGQQARVQVASNGTRAVGGQTVANGPGGVESVGTPRGNAPLGGSAQTGEVPRTSLRQSVFGSGKAWGDAASGLKQGVVDKLTYQPTAPSSIAPGALRRMASGLGKTAGVVGGAFSAAQVPDDIKSGNYGDAALHSTDALAAAAIFTPAAPAAALYGMGRTAQVVGNAIGESLPASVQDKIGSAVNTGLRGAGNLIGQKWGVDDSAYKASLRNPQPTASAATQPSPTALRPVANPALPAANTQPTPANTLRGQSGTDMGGGISKFVQGGRTLYSNVQGGDNDNLMNRGPTSAQNQSAMDGIQQRQNQGDTAYAANRQYAAEVADAQALREGPTYINSFKAQTDRRGQDMIREVALRGQDIMREGHFLTNDVAKANARYQMNKDKRDFDISRSDYANTRSDKAAEQSQSADKAWNDHANSLFQIRDDKGNSVPDTKTTADYTRTVDNTVAQMIPMLAKSADPKDRAHAADLAKRGRAALDNEDKGNLQKWFATRQAHAGSSGIGPFSSGGAVSDNLFDYASGKPSSTLAQNRTDYGGGRSIPNVNLRYGPDANHWLPNMGPGSTYLTPNNLRGN